MSHATLAACSHSPLLPCAWRPNAHSETSGLEQQLEFTIALLGTPISWLQRLHLVEGGSGHCWYSSTPCACPQF